MSELIYEDNSLSKDQKSIKEDIENKSVLSSTLDDHFKSIGVAKSEILNQQCQNPFFRAFFLFTVFLIGFAYMLDGNVRGTYTAYATGSFGHASLVSTITVVTGIIGAAGQIVFARLADSFDRIAVYVFSVMLYVVGTIIQSQATNVARYAVGAIFYELGYVGVVLILVIIVSDFSSLRWRLLYVITPSLSYVIIAWIYGYVVDAVGAEEHWSWGVGMWAFIFPLLNIPFLLCVGYMWWNARKLESWKSLEGVRINYIKKNGLYNFFLHFFWELDVVGLLLFVVCLGCILVPLTLAGGYQSEWSKGHIIAPIVVGVVLIPVTIAWEAYISKHPVCPSFFYKNRGVWPLLGISFMFMVVDYVESEYLYQVLIVAVNQSVLSATRIIVLSSFVSTLVCFFYGFLIVSIRRLKPGIIIGTVLWLVAGGLMYHFRGGTTSRAGIIGAEVVLGFGTGLFSDELTVIMQSNVSHEQMAAVTAMGYVVYRVGGSVGSCISGAIWTQVAYKKLAKTLGDATIAEEFFSSPYTAVETYTWGSPERELVVEAYRQIQRILVIVAMCLNVILICLAIITKDRKLIAEQSYNQKDEEEVEEKDSFDIYTYIKSKFSNKVNHV